MQTLVIYAILVLSICGLFTGCWLLIESETYGEWLAAALLFLVSSGGFLIAFSGLLHKP